MGHQNLASIAAMAADGLGNLYVGGSYANTSLRIGATVLPNLSGMYPPPIGPAPPNPYTNRYYTDAFVARLDAATGTWNWAVRNGGTSAEVAFGIIADRQGRVYARGTFINPLNGVTNLVQLDGGTGT